MYNQALDRFFYCHVGSNDSSAGRGDAWSLQLSSPITYTWYLPSCRPFHLKGRGYYLKEMLAQKAQHSHSSVPLLPSVLLFTVSVDDENCHQLSLIGVLLLLHSIWCHEACILTIHMHAFFLSAQTWMILKRDSNNDIRFLEVQCWLSTVTIWEPYS